MSPTVIRDSFFQLREANGYMRCDDGLFEGKDYISLDEEEWQKAKLTNVTAKKSREVDFNITFPPPDFLVTGLRDYCLSERAFEIFKAKGLNLSPQFDWTPVRVVGFFEEFIGTYWWPRHHPHAAYDVFDYEHSKFSIYESLKNPKLYKDVSEWVLRRDLIGALDFFYGCRIYWYGSPRLKQIVEQHQLLGFKFIPVATWAPGVRE